MLPNPCGHSDIESRTAWANDNTVCPPYYYYATNGIAGRSAAVDFFQHQGEAARGILFRSARRHGARLCADDRDIQESGEGQQLADFCGLLVACGCKCAFRSFFDAFNRNRGKHTGTQGALILLLIAQVGIVLK